jgi:hypothetical protein
MLVAKAIRTGLNTYDVKLNGSDLIWDCFFRHFPSMQAFAEYLCEITDSESCQLTLVENGNAGRTITV